MEWYTELEFEDGQEGVVEVMVEVWKGHEGSAMQLKEGLEKMGKKKMRQKFEGAGMKVRVKLEVRED